MKNKKAVIMTYSSGLKRNVTPDTSDNGKSCMNNVIITKKATVTNPNNIWTVTNPVFYFRFEIHQNKVQMI